MVRIAIVMVSTASSKMTIWRLTCTRTYWQSVIFLHLSWLLERRMTYLPHSTTTTATTATTATTTPVPRTFAGMERLNIISTCLSSS